MESKKALKKLARHLLATTCLTAAAVGAASANTIVTEASVGGADFGNNFGLRNSLTAGVNEVQGGTTGSEQDWFQFNGLQGSGAFSFSVETSAFQTFTVWNSSGSNILTSRFGTGSLSGTTPGDGILVFQVTGNETTGNYDIVLNAEVGTATPEPSTLGAMGLGLAGAFALRRKLSRK